MEAERFNEKSIAERENDLWNASEQYMLGEINAEKLKEIELPYESDFKAATRQIAPFQVQWAFIVIITLLTIIMIVIPIVLFYITKSSLSLSPILVVIPLGYAWRRITMYLFLMDEKKFHLEAMKIQKKAQRSSKVN